LGTVAPFKLAETARIDHLVVADIERDLSQFEQADVRVHVAGAV
jgi:hypothetical protein